jgi:hypothetical protein
LLGVGSELGATNDDNAIVTALRRGNTDSLNQAGQQVVLRKSQHPAVDHDTAWVPGARDRQSRPRVCALSKLRTTAMAKLKLTAVPDDRPVKLTVELPATVHRDLVAYAEVLGRQSGQTIEPAKLIPPMLARFMSTDRAFARTQREKRQNG